MPMILRSTQLSLALLALMSQALIPAMAIAQRSTTPDYDYLPPAEVAKITLGDAEQAVLVRPWQGRNQYGAAVLLGDLGDRKSVV